MAAGDAELVKMAVLARRSAVPAPTIKHYIREGLLPGPAVRTSRNMAYYDVWFVDRSRAIKQLQAERFLPLRSRRGPARGARPHPPALRRTSQQRRTRSEVMKTFGLTRAELTGLERAGVLALQGSGATAGYGGIDLELLELLAEVRRAGLGEVFPASVAEAYVAAVKQLVAVEIEVFRDRVLAGVALPRPLPDIARVAVGLGERLVLALRAKLLPAMLERLAPG